MPFLLRLLLLALAGISLVGARRASQHAGTPTSEARVAPNQSTLIIPVASRR